MNNLIQILQIYDRSQIISLFEHKIQPKIKYDVTYTWPTS